MGRRSAAVPVSPPGFYFRPSDPVTERIVGEFEDFIGWMDTEPGVPTSEPFSEDVAVVTEPPLVAEAPVAAVATIQPGQPVCPSCKVPLPDRNHLVSSANIRLREAFAAAGAPSLSTPTEREIEDLESEYL